jgi:hypothetical protein
MQTSTTISSNTPRKIPFKKKDKKAAQKAKVVKFASAFYARYGSMMSKLSHE